MEGKSLTFTFSQKHSILKGLFISCVPSDVRTGLASTYCCLHLHANIKYVIKQHSKAVPWDGKLYRRMMFESVVVIVQRRKHASEAEGHFLLLFSTAFLKAGLQDGDYRMSNTAAVLC